MADSFTVGSYEFFGGNYHVQLLDTTPPAPLPAALDVWAADPTRRMWPFVVMHENATRVIDGYVQCTTEALARAELAAIQAACVPGATVTYQPDGQTTAVSCQLLDASVTPKVLDPTGRLVATDGYFDLAVTLTTRPYWLGSEVTTTLTVPATTPWTATVSDVPGTVPALTETRYTHAQVITGLALGLRSDPGAAFTPTQDYGGAGHTDDATALGGECQQITTGASHATIGAPTALDAVGMRGDFLTMARVKCGGATVAAEFYRAQSSAIGPIGAAMTINGTEANPVTASDAGWDVLNLGVMSIPAGRVQAGLSGGGWSPETLEVEQTTGTSTCAVNDTTTQTQTFKAVHTGRLSRIPVKVAAVVTAGSQKAKVYRGTTMIASVTFSVTDAGWVDVSPFTCAVVAGETLSVVLGGTTGLLAGSFTLNYSATSVYADGVRTGGGDLCFKTYEQVYSTYGTTMNIQARASAGTPTARLDTVALIPTDEGAVRVTMPATTAGQGVDIDYLAEDDNEHGIYIADATTSGTSLIATAEPYGPVLLRPGDNSYVGMADTPIDAVPGDATVSVTYRSRWLLPYTGD